MTIFKLTAEFYMGGAMGREEVSHLYDEYFTTSKSAKKYAEKVHSKSNDDTIKWKKSSDGFRGSAAGPNYIIKKIRVKE